MLSPLDERSNVQPCLAPTEIYMEVNVTLDIVSLCAWFAAQQAEDSEFECRIETLEMQASTLYVILGFGPSWQDQSRETPDQSLKYQIECSGFVACATTVGRYENIRVSTDHLLLDAFTAQTGDLYFHENTAPVENIIGILYLMNEAYYSGLYPLSESVNRYFLPPNVNPQRISADGLLASGPIPLLERFATAIALYTKTTIIPGEMSHYAELQAILFGTEGFIVCSGCRVRKIDGKRPVDV